VLINKGKCQFEVAKLKGLQIEGQVKSIKKIKIKDKNLLLVARNNDKLMVLEQKNK
jgi:hypothetical protein